MPIATTSIWIPAPPSSVWRVLADTDAWPAWNPVQPGLRALLAPGAKGLVAVRAGGRVAWLPIRMVAVDPERTLSWSGGVPGLFHAIHGFDLTPEDDGTRVAHVEAFSGVVPLVLWRSLERQLLPRYSAVNRALRDRVQSTA
ncbi:MAG: hypothetical protein ACI8PZ_004392 [Myxococcota bacterium]|jgi:hypothetical protein